MGVPVTFAIEVALNLIFPLFPRSGSAERARGLVDSVIL